MAYDRSLRLRLTVLDHCLSADFVEEFLAFGRIALVKQFVAHLTFQGRVGGVGLALTDRKHLDTLRRRFRRSELSDFYLVEYLSQFEMGEEALALCSVPEMLQAAKGEGRRFLEELLANAQNGNAAQFDCLAATALLAKKPRPDDSDINAAMAESFWPRFRNA